MRWWHRYVPHYAANPFSLAVKLLRSENPAARSAMFMAAAGILLTPLDMLLRPSERGRYRRAQAPEFPLLIVTGPPRSGSTLLGQFLINSFDVGYLNNLTSLFPRAPVTALKLFGRFAPRAAGGYSAFYGKSTRLSGANDGLYIWDRWLGADRELVPDQLEVREDGSIVQFFGALETVYRRPVVNKVNRLVACADLVGEAHPNAYFICLYRDPLYLAQSLYVAREQIMGDLSKSYGPSYVGSRGADPIEDVCNQVSSYAEHIKRQQSLLGAERFSVVAYEDFCARPAALAEALVARHESLCFADGFSRDVEPFEASRSRRLPEAVMTSLASRLDELAIEPPLLLDF